MTTNTKNLSRRSALAGLAGTAAAGVVALPAGAAAAPIEPDPIFAVIAEHHATMKEWIDALRREDEFRRTPERDAATEAACEACEREKEYLLKVLTVQPTTLAGVLALLEHVGQEEFLGYGSSGGSDETVLSSWCHANDGEPLKEAAMSFPLRLAGALRTITRG